MKNMVLIMLMFAAHSAFAKPAAYVCAVSANPHQTALVAGEYFKMTIDEDFGMNANFSMPVKLESPYLGTCLGRGEENNHPLAEGYSGMAPIGGSECAADGFDIFLGAGVTDGNHPGLIQIDAGDTEVFYNCIRIARGS